MSVPDFDTFKSLWIQWNRDRHEVASTQMLFDDLNQLRVELCRWQMVKNFVSRETLDDIWHRHFLDSLQLIKFIAPDQKNILDFGSGAGFPGLVLAMALKPDVATMIHLVESNQRKASYLKAMVRKFSLNVQVWANRSENLDPTMLGDIDLITGRAFRPLTAFFDLTARFWYADVIGLLHKGQNYMSEIEIARSDWRFDLLHYASETDHQSVILRISNLQSAHQ